MNKDELLMIINGYLNGKTYNKVTYEDCLIAIDNYLMEDENFYDTWLAIGLPDGYTKEDIEFMVNDEQILFDAFDYAAYALPQI